MLLRWLVLHASTYPTDSAATAAAAAAAAAACVVPFRRRQAFPASLRPPSALPWTTGAGTGAWRACRCGAEVLLHSCVVHVC
jgi:hypothetical protein